jgi:hypothetical protein
MNFSVVVSGSMNRRVVMLVMMPVLMVMAAGTGSFVMLMIMSMHMRRVLMAAGTVFAVMMLMIAIMPTAHITHAFPFAHYLCVIRRVL